MMIYKEQKDTSSDIEVRQEEFGQNVLNQIKVKNIKRKYNKYDIRKGTLSKLKSQHLY